MDNVPPLIVQKTASGSTKLLHDHPGSAYAHDESIPGSNVSRDLVPLVEAEDGKSWRCPECGRVEAQA